MNHLRRVLTAGVLGSLAAVAARAADEPIRLVVDNQTQTLRVEAGMSGAALLVLGPLAFPPIVIGDITLDVVPHHVLSLGYVEFGTSIPLFVPRALSALHAEAILFDPQKITLCDSNVVALDEAFADLIEATFRAVLASTDSIPPYYSVGASLTAPTTGHDFVVDGYQLDDGVMHVWLRLITPVEIVIPVNCRHEVSVHLGSDVGREVHVHLARTPRGQIVPEVYKLMAVLPVFSS